MLLTKIKVYVFLVLVIGLGGESYSQAVPWSVKMSATAMSAWPIGTPGNWNYEQGLIMRSIETVWGQTNNVSYYNYIKGKVDHFVSASGVISTYNINDYNLDHVASGRSLMFLYKQTNLEKYRLAANTLRSQLTNQPRTTSGGFWHKKIYTNQMWLDGLFMAEPFYTEYAKQFGPVIDYDDIALQIILMEAKSRDPLTGLLYHGWDESKTQAWSNPVTGCSPSFWGRAMGWYAMSLVDVLDNFPKTHPKRDTIINILNRLSVAIIKYQDPASGVWYQVLDKGSQAGNYKESSASCMFVYTLAKACRMGYINTSYQAKAKLGYTGILNTFVTTDAQNKVLLSGICPVAGLGGTPYRSGTYDYYISSKPVTNDPKGVGSFILASVEMEMLEAILTDLETSTEETGKITFYPNPVSDKLFISGTLSNSFSYKVSDLTGKLLGAGTGPDIEMQNIKPGYYLVEIDDSGRKVIKQIQKK